MGQNKRPQTLLDFFKEYNHEYFDTIMGKHRRENQEYQKAAEARGQTGDKIEYLFADDSPVMQYIEAADVVTAMELDLFYLQGFRDCVTVLKKIGMIC